ncbi:MAG: metal ABC transporter ATP-binding protein [Caloramator sp.]|nr:metal ABC transporter ATP-binding protein [Caloramator sp.]
MKVVEVNNLSFGYADNLILKNINFSVEKGDFLGIIGSNGSGKSTLIKLMLKILTPLSGEIKLLGENINSFNNWSSIGYVSQKSNSFNTSFPATVEEVVGANIYSKIGLFRISNKSHHDMILKAIKLVGLEDCSKKLIGNLSGGQQQRVFIARALVNNPKILFLDEPTVGIDSKSQSALYCLLSKLQKELGITIIMVTHDIQDIAIHANNLIYLGENGIINYTQNQNIKTEFLKQIYGIDLKLDYHNCKNNLKKEGIKC